MQMILLRHANISQTSYASLHSQETYFKHSMQRMALQQSGATN